MNTTQMMGWLICLILAFFATVVSVRASLQAALNDRHVEQMRAVADDRQELLTQIRDALERIAGHMDAQAAPLTEPAAVEDVADSLEPAATSATTFRSASGGSGPGPSRAVAPPQ
ncbi:MAG: hypothetical protein GXY85_07250 [Candidatus Brocadiaceae bacterium]|nr:hypothetical protein [Candidatus Brocadiaceae bacterium]